MGRFSDALAGAGLGAIAEIKRRSPSARRHPAGRRSGAARRALRARPAPPRSRSSSTSASAAAGTTCAPRAPTTSVPLLAKGFFSTRGDLRTATEAGADAVLLLLRDLDDAQTRTLMRIAGELGLDTLVEAHDAEELERARQPRRARDRRQRPRPLHVRDRPRRAARARREASRADRIVVAESGIRTRAQGAAAELAGADAILVGSALMQRAGSGGEAARAAARGRSSRCAG